MNALKSKFPKKTQSSLKVQVRDLSRALFDEKKKSRLAMQKLLEDAESMIAESAVGRDDLDTKLSAAELAIEKEREIARGRERREEVSVPFHVCR